MLSVGAAALVSQALPVQRSYWVVLTVAIVLRPDFGSVFARALQRGIGTVVGAVLGAIILIIIPAGPLLLIPVAVFAGLLPYGRDRNWGLFSTFLTPLVVILIDLLHRTGWLLALDRLIDTALGCAIVLLVGYAPWPSSWHAHLPEQLAIALDSVARYTQQALPGQPGPVSVAPPVLPSPIRPAHGVSADDGRATLGEQAGGPAVARRRRPGAGHGHRDRHRRARRRHRPAPCPRDVEQLAAAVRDMARGVRDGQLPADLPLPRSDDVRELADCVADLRRAASGEQAA